uniref:Uncharacterized protein n=1 Tax=Romanomermis culicivorax TaxID=13658 RepID=A0A915JXE3_ROMCU
MPAAHFSTIFFGREIVGVATPYELERLAPVLDSVVGPTSLGPDGHLDIAGVDFHEAWVDGAGVSRTGLFVAGRRSIFVLVPLNVERFDRRIGGRCVNRIVWRLLRHGRRFRSGRRGRRLAAGCLLLSVQRWSTFVGRSGGHIFR